MVEIARQVICKNCGSDAVIKYGTYKQEQEYFCKNCLRKFKNNKLPFHKKVSNQYVNAVLNMYYAGISTNKIRVSLRDNYDYSPSKHSVFSWLGKYSSIAAEQSFEDHPKVGNTWIAAETTIITYRGIVTRILDILDVETWYLLASEPILHQNTNYQQVIYKSIQKAGKNPEIVLTNEPAAYILNNIEDDEHTENIYDLMPLNEFKETFNLFQSFIADRARVIKFLRTMERLKLLIHGYQVYHNYFKPENTLFGKTPSEIAQTEYCLKNWTDLAIPVIR